MVSSDVGECVERARRVVIVTLEWVSSPVSFELDRLDLVVACRVS